VRKTSGYVSSEKRTRFSGDHLYAICRGLAREKVRRGGKHTFTTKEVDEVIGDAFALTQPTKDEEKVIATHECGHALVAALTPAAARPDKVTIEGEEDEPSTFYTRFDQTHQGIIFNRPEAEARLAVSLGGRVAEEVVYGQPSAGAADDLLRASMLGRAMVEMWGMGSNLTSAYEETREGLQRRRLSDGREQVYDNDVDGLLSHAKERVHVLLTEHRATLEAMAALLLQKRVLEMKDLKEFFAGRGMHIDWRDQLKLKDLDPTKPEPAPAATAKA
jgi:cell division protease FtsH